MRRARWLVVPVAVIAVVVVVLLVSGGSPSSSPPAAVADAATATSSAPGANMTMAMQLSVAGHTVTMSGGGFESFASRQGQMNLRVEGAQALGAAGQGATFNVIFQSTRMFMQSSLIPRSVTGGKPWIELNLAAALSKEGLSPSLLSESPSDPAQYLDYLRAASGSVHNLGTATIRGVQTTHYQATLDLSRYANLVPASQRAAARASIARLEQMMGATSLPTDVWIDSQHRVRQIELSFHPTSGTLAGAGFSEKVTVDLFNFGPKPAVSAPPASQTFDATQIAGGTHA